MLGCALKRARTSRVHRRALAQLAEHRSPKPKVGGSSPSCPAGSVRSSRPTMVERRRGEGVPDSKAVHGERGGSAHKRTSIPTFYRQVVAELRKVVYPTQEQLITYFIVVMALVSLLDLGFGKLAFEIFSGGSGS